MSLADSIHIFTVLGSRAGFSAEMTDVTKGWSHGTFTASQKIEQPTIYKPVSTENNGGLE